MSQETGTKKAFSLVRNLLGARDSFLEDFARVTHAVTATNAWQQANAALAKPVLLFSAILKQKREAAMSDLLAKLNMPSREDVLTLSQRLTRIEMVLDDLGAGVDQLRRVAERPQRPAAREASTREPRPSTVLAALTPEPQAPAQHSKEA